jgi:hypothetical protein
MLLVMALFAQLGIAGSYDEALANLSTPKLEVKAPVNGLAWGTGYDSYDYIKPCPSATAYAAIIVHGVNRRDVLESNDTGELSYYGDVSVGYSGLVEQCAMLVSPKSGIITTFNDNGESFRWRTWWYTSAVPIRDYDDELEALIQLINEVDNELIQMVNDASGVLVGIPIYLVIGNDYGKLTAEVMEELSVMRNSAVIDGFIHINRNDGKVTKYDRT